MGDSYLDLLMAQQETAEEEVSAEGGGVWVVVDVIDSNTVQVESVENFEGNP